MIKLLKRMRRREALMALVCAVLVVAQVYFDLKLPDYMTRLTTLIKTPGSVTSDILSVGGQMLLCTLASAVLAVGCGYLAAKTASGFSFSVRADLFHHVMDAGSEEMQSFSVPSLITRTTNDITQIQMIVAMGLQMLMKAPIMAVWAVIKILGKSWTLSAVTGGFVVAIVVMVLLIMSSCLPRFRQVQKKTDQINRVARENLTGINVVHAFGAEDYQNRKFDGPSRDMMNLQLKNQRLFALLQPMLGLGMNGLALAIYWVGAALVESIALTDPAARLTMFTNVLVFSTYATYVVMSFMMLVMIFMLVPQAQVSAERINEVLDTKPHVVPGTKTEGEERGTVEFRDVSFRYPGAAADELELVLGLADHRKSQTRREGFFVQPEVFQNVLHDPLGIARVIDREAARVAVQPVDLPPENAAAGSVERHGPYVHGVVAQQCLQSGLQLVCSFVCERDGQNRPRRGGTQCAQALGLLLHGRIARFEVVLEICNVFLRDILRNFIRVGAFAEGDEIGNAVDEHGRLAAPRTGQQQQRPLRRENALALHVVQVLKARRDHSAACR